MADRRLPHDLEAEHVVCAGVVSGGAPALAEIHAEGCHPDDFSHPAHEALQLAAQELDRGGKLLTKSALAQELKRQGTAERLGVFGGAATFLHKLADTIVPLPELRDHAVRVRDLARRRRVILAASDIVDLGYREDGDPLGYLAEAQRRFTGAFDRGVMSRAQTFAALMPQALRRLDVRHEEHGKGITGITTGFADLNDRCGGGLFPGRVYTIAGRPGSGKTSLAMQCVINAARAGVPGYVFSIEMTAADMTDRAIVQEARVDATRFAQGVPDLLEWREIIAGSGRLAELPLWIDDSTGVTLSELRAKLRRWRAEHPGPAMVMIDYLQLLEAEEAPGRDLTEERILARFSKGIVALAKELQVPVIQLAQLNREVEKRGGKPKMSDLRGSGQIEQDSAAVMLLHHVKNRCDVLFGKNRFGSSDPVSLAFVGASTRFESYRGVG